MICIENTTNVYRVLRWSPEGKRPLGRHGHRWKDNIKIYFKEIGKEGVHWIYVAQDRDLWWSLMNTLMNLWAS
jgi:hypothetical protein